MSITSNYKVEDNVKAILGLSVHEKNKISVLPRKEGTDIGLSRTIEVADMTISYIKDTYSLTDKEEGLVATLEIIKSILTEIDGVRHIYYDAARCFHVQAKALRNISAESIPVLEDVLYRILNLRRNLNAIDETEESIDALVNHTLYIVSESIEGSWGEHEEVRETVVPGLKEGISHLQEFKRQLPTVFVLYDSLAEVRELGAQQIKSIDAAG